VARDGRNLVATPKGIQLIDQLHAAGVEVLASPEMTGQWEYQLKQMEQGQADRAVFMREIRELAAKIVERTRQFSQQSQEKPLPDFDATCPLCGARGLKQTDLAIACHTPKCRLKIFKTVAGRPISEAEIRRLLETRFAGPFEGFRSRFGKEFSAALELKDTGKVDFAFQISPEQEAASAAVHDPQNILCPCPVCAEAGRTKNIYDTPAGFICETHLREEKDRCKPKASLPKELCKVRLDRDEARRFFTEGATTLIEKFISKKGRPFSAQLVRNSKGKRILEWKFPPRERKPAAKKPARVAGQPAEAARQSDHEPAA
jgi:DNA topoisomerase-3